MAGPDTVLVRYGELALKRGIIRTRFEDTLVANIAATLSHRGIEHRISRERGRILIRTPMPDACAAATARVFGVVSCSVAETCPAGIDTVAEESARLAAAGIPQGATFAVRARRAGVHPFTSQDVARAVGSRILGMRPDLRVDLDAPEREVFVEVRQKRAYLFASRVEGVGGLPLGTQGRTVCLVSGGIDSPVAAWLMMKRGCIPVFAHFLLAPFGDDAHRERAVEACRHLAGFAHGHRVRLHLVPHGASLEAFARSCPRRLQCVLCRRMMYRVADAIAAQERALSLTTGESLGQVASQTAENLFAEDAVAGRPVLRPLIGLDKIEIQRIGERIGTFSISIRPASCCTIVPDLPEKRARLDDVEAAERAVDVDGLVADALRGTEVRVLEPPRDTAEAGAPPAGDAGGGGA